MTSDNLPDNKTYSLKVLHDELRHLLKYYSPSCLVADALKDNDCIMASYIKPLFSARIAGHALTVSIEPDDCFSNLEMLKHIKSGHVVVIDAHGETELSVLGGIKSQVLKQKGACGAVVDGAVRDTDEIKDIGFPVFSKAVAPRSFLYACKEDFANKPANINIPVRCGGVLVNPNDIIVGDDTGITVVPFDRAAGVIKKAMEVAKKEGDFTKSLKERILDIKEIIEMTRKVIFYE